MDSLSVFFLDIFTFVFAIVGIFLLGYLFGIKRIGQVVDQFAELVDGDDNFYYNEPDDEEVLTFVAKDPNGLSIFVDSDGDFVYKNGNPAPIQLSYPAPPQDGEEDEENSFGFASRGDAA